MHTIHSYIICNIYRDDNGRAIFKHLYKVKLEKQYANLRKYEYNKTSIIL
jgi:hypothetical protein